MKKGKRTRVRAIVYQTLNFPTQTKCDGIKLMVEAVENIKPICKVEKVGVAATFKRCISYWISLEKCSFAEILDAYRKRGNAHKKMENLYRLASTNRSFAHFRWW
uniref:Small ribosomal subunit protein uS7 domain-containing protein n=1 Tax=Cucumis melo TaxID=3656 RepID=A0A9I9DNJ0_CUCME